MNLCIRKYESIIKWLNYKPKKDCVLKISFVTSYIDKIESNIIEIVELANELIERSHDVLIHTPDGNVISKKIHFMAKEESYDKLFNDKYDAIIYHDPEPHIFNLVQNTNAKVKIFYLLSPHDLIQLVEKGNLNEDATYPERPLVLKKSLTNFFILTNATWEKEYLKRRLNIESHLLIGGINHELFRPIGQKRNSDKIRILYHSDGSKSHEETDVVLNALEIVKKEFPDIMVEAVYEHILEYDKLPLQYSQADIFVDGSLHAGWNSYVAWAMACKVPVVCMDIGGNKDFAFHERTALLVQPDDVEKMASAIIRLIKDEKLRKTLMENAYNHVRQFDWSKSAGRLEEILKSELSKKE